MSSQDFQENHAKKLKAWRVSSQDFQENHAQYRDQFVSLLEEAELLDQNKNTNNSYRVNLEEKVALLQQQWEAAGRRLDEHKRATGEGLKSWQHFLSLVNKLSQGADEIEEHRGFAPPGVSSIQGIKVHFEHVKVCVRINKFVVWTLI